MKRPNETNCRRIVHCRCGIKLSFFGENYSICLQHIINYSDEDTLCSKAMSVGVDGCEIWMKIDGNVPADASELSCVAIDSVRLTP